MPDIYDIDYTQQTPEILSPDKRDRNTRTLVASLLSAVQWCRDLMFTSYKKGSVAPHYASGIYNRYAQVIFEKAVYYSLIDGNTALPTDTTKWLKIQENFIGVDERIKFNGQNLVLEYALNKRFGGTFRPPGSSSPSDIYLTYVPAVISGFLVGVDEFYCSTVGQTLSSATIGGKVLYQPINFTIMFLNALYIQTNDSEINNFVNLYIPTSLNFSITTY